MAEVDEDQLIPQRRPTATCHAEQPGDSVGRWNKDRQKALTTTPPRCISRSSPPGRSRREEGRRIAASRATANTHAAHRCKATWRVRRRGIATRPLTPEALARPGPADDHTATQSRPAYGGCTHSCIRDLKCSKGPTVLDALKVPSMPRRWQFPNECALLRTLSPLKPKTSMNPRENEAPGKLCTHFTQLSRTRHTSCLGLSSSPSHPRLPKPNELQLCALCHLAALILARRREQSAKACIPNLRSNTGRPLRARLAAVRALGLAKGRSATPASPVPHPHKGQPLRKAPGTGMLPRGAIGRQYTSPKSSQSDASLRRASPQQVG